MSNPFKVKWLAGWKFQLVYLGSNVKLEAYGFGTCLITSLSPGESPILAADRLVYSETKHRRSLYHSWKKQKSQIDKVNFSLSNIARLNINRQKIQPSLS